MTFLLYNLHNYYTKQWNKVQNKTIQRITVNSQWLWYLNHIHAHRIDTQEENRYHKRKLYGWKFSFRKEENK